MDILPDIIYSENRKENVYEEYQGCRSQRGTEHITGDQHSLCCALLMSGGKQTGFKRHREQEHF